MSLLASSARGQAAPPTVYFEFQVEKAVTVKEPSVPVYPEILRRGLVSGQVLAQFIVNVAGEFEPNSFRVLKSSHELFTQAVRDALPKARFTPAMLKGQAVPQLVQMPFDFSITSPTPRSAPSVTQSSAPVSARQILPQFRPSFIRFGTSLASMRDVLSRGCSAVRVRPIDPVFRVLRGLTGKQYQADCEGLVFEGKPRHAEFVFSDDGLELVWIMTTAEERDQLSQRMSSIFGAPDMTNQKFMAWTTNVAALRTDVAEVLFYSDRIGERVREWFGPNSTF
jgi:TonB family protein